MSVDLGSTLDGVAFIDAYLTDVEPEDDRVILMEGARVLLKEGFPTEAARFARLIERTYPDQTTWPWSRPQTRGHA